LSSPNFYEATAGRRTCNDPAIVVPPSCQGSVAADRHNKSIAFGNGNEVASRRGIGDLAILVTSPCMDNSLSRCKLRNCASNNDSGCKGRFSNDCFHVLLLPRCSG